MNAHNFKRGRTQIANDLETCLTEGHLLSDVWPFACLRRCMYSPVIRPDYDPATAENIARIRAQAAMPWAPYQRQEV